MRPPYIAPMADDSPQLLTGAALIKDHVRRLPDAPGVYRMFGEGGEALYASSKGAGR